MAVQLDPPAETMSVRAALRSPRRSTMDTLSIIAPYALAMALVGLLESLMTAKLVDDVTDTHSDKTRKGWGRGDRSSVPVNRRPLCRSWSPTVAGRAGDGADAPTSSRVVVRVTVDARACGRT
ncbi:hypothetical protein [Rhodococcus tibetensis]|uniref:Uncharacterized protein n=1 Tax=Rhodococcus tibetensis TaxID=2965064 RepID=A0ABT1QG67_9NOCA|nr:hypothetical protein [Rhodococcus sp. FXJ9.536]MCQ4121283.1 hypothetical protein [Rhodococcus sp. FXJ9.536]